VGVVEGDDREKRGCEWKEEENIKGRDSLANCPS
jgi:hypothetical protein